MSKPDKSATISATIRVPDASGRMERALRAEHSDAYDRSGYTLTQAEGHVVFEIRAQDPVALRAALNSVAKQVIVYKQMEDIQDDK